MGSRGTTPPFLTLALDVGEWSASCPGYFIPGDHWIGGWVGPRVSLDAVEKRKISCPYWELNPGCPAHGLTAQAILSS
jgi:hypothetical protein